MKTKVAAIESKIANLEILLKEMRNQADNQEKIISLLSLSKGGSGEGNSHNKGGDSDEEGMFEKLETMHVVKHVTVVGVKSEPKKENEREEQVTDHRGRGRRIASGLEKANALRCEIGNRDGIGEKRVEGDSEVQQRFGDKLKTEHEMGNSKREGGCDRDDERYWDGGDHKSLLEKLSLKKPPLDNGLSETSHVREAMGKSCVPL